MATTATTRTVESIHLAHNPSQVDILSIVERYTPLRKTGKEYTGRCIFHDDKNPSFSVTEDKGLFYCFSCGVGGDAITFVEMAEGVPFKEAIKILGMDGSPQGTNRHSNSNSTVRFWAKDQIQKLNAKIHELDEQIELADEIPDVELAESLWRERLIVADFRDDLRCSKYRAEFVEMKELIEKIAE